MWRSYFSHLLFLVTMGLAANLIFVKLLFPNAQYVQEQQTAKGLHGVFLLVDEVLKRNSQQQIPVLLQTINQHSALAIALLPRTATELDEYALNTLDSGDTLVTDVKRITAYRQSSMSQHIIKIGPLEYTDEVAFIESTASWTIVFIVLVTSLLWTAWQNYKVSLLQGCMSAYSQGKLAVRAKLGMLTVGELNKHFNKMASRIQVLINQQRYMTNALAHELRTPLSKIQFYMENLVYEGVNENQQYIIKNIERNISEIDQLVNEMIRFSRLEQKHIELDTKEIDINAWLQSVAQEFDMQSSKDVSVNFPSKSILYSCDTGLLSRVFWNVAMNSERYAKSCIDIQLMVIDHHIEIRISNDGDPIASNQHEAIFKPFVRLDKSRNYLTGGHGLGLAIAKEIVTLHSGTITVQDISTPFVGAAFVIYLPIINQ